MLNNISIDAALINNGIWKSLLNSKFLIASVDSTAFKQAVVNFGLGELSESDLIRIMANTILLDWMDVKDPNGYDLPYSKELAEIALRDNEDVRCFVDTVSTNLGLYCEQL